MTDAAHAPTPPAADPRQTERDADVYAISEALGLFPSCIKSGEPWTPTCQAVRDKAAAALRRLSEPPAHVIIEASEAGPGSGFDWALTIAWPDGTETLEKVSDHTAKLLDFDVEESDGTKPPRPLTAAQQATLDLNNHRGVL